MAETKRLVVVGGGITGLAAAHAARGIAREQGRDLAVTLVEESPRFGGNIVTAREGGFVLDGAADSWVANKPHASALARELGLGDAMIGTTPENRRYYIAHEGRLHAVPEGLVLGVPTRARALTGTRLFSLPGKLRMALELLVPRRRSEDDESIADFARRRLGREAADRLVAPLLGGISAGDATDLSVGAAFPQLVAMEREHGSLVRGMRAQQRARRAANGGREGSAFVTLGGGVGSLVDALAKRLQGEDVELRRGVGIRAIARAGDRWALATHGGDAIVADAVLLAIPAHAASRLTSALDATLEGMLGAMQSATTATVFLAYARADVGHPLDASGFVVPRSAGRPILAGTWVSSKWSGRAPEGQVLLRVFVGGPLAAAALERDDAELVRLARGELRDLMGIAADPRMTRVFRFVRGSVQMRVGHADHMRALRARLAEVAPRVAVAGGGYDGIGIPDCIRQGQDAARALIALT
ncbi:MAG TPA: protoporphyrinogen oxidase [Polyangiaceae bacterium]|jgi:oxygen-dependent protoporphyrinogen oxidase|nr:protoporphyrinogen oxidase [Polyangiaceae bacterium]